MFTYNIVLVTETKQFFKNCSSFSISELNVIIMFLFSCSDDLRSIVIPEGDLTLPSIPIPFLGLNLNEKCEQVKFSNIKSSLAL